jgi:DNA-binding PadR family transcriptional regulator
MNHTHPQAAYCDMRGMLSFLILFLLSKKPMHGTQLSDEIGARKGIKPSPGTIYPALKELHEAGLISERKDGKTIVYSLTDTGRAELRVAKQQFCRIFVGVFSE